MKNKAREFFESLSTPVGSKVFIPESVRRALGQKRMHEVEGDSSNNIDPSEGTEYEGVPDFSDWHLYTHLKTSEEVKGLLDAGLDPNMSVEGTGILILVMAYIDINGNADQVGIVKALLDAGADPDKKFGKHTARSWIKGKIAAAGKAASYHKTNKVLTTPEEMEKYKKIEALYGAEIVGRGSR